MTGPTYTILVPTIGQRQELFLRLMDRLLPQLDEFVGRVRVLAWLNSGTPRLAELRDALLRGADSEYVSFVDDDDLVPEYFVAEVMRALDERPDHIGFRLEYWSEGRMAEIVDHSIKHGKWGRSPEKGLFRDLTHIDPIRRDLAMRGRFANARPGNAEDRVWVRQVRGHLMTEVYIDKIMYHYLWSSITTSWQEPGRILPSTGRPPVEHPYFAWHPESE